MIIVIALELRVMVPRLSFAILIVNFLSYPRVLYSKIGFLLF